MGCSSDGFSSDDDCKAGSGTGGGDGTGTGTTEKKPCCSLAMDQISAQCKDTDKTLMMAMVRFSCRAVLRRGSAPLSMRHSGGLRRRQGSRHRVLPPCVLSCPLPRPLTPLALHKRQVAGLKQVGACADTDCVGAGAYTIDDLKDASFEVLSTPTPLGVPRLEQQTPSSHIISHHVIS